jgi:twitching motility protein PilT
MEPYDDELQRIVAELNRAAPNAAPHLDDSPRPAIKAIPSTTSSLEQLLTFASQRSASDVLLIAGAPIAIRLNGAVSTTGTALLSGQEIQDMLFPFLSHEQHRELGQKRSLDFGFVRPNGVRCRANLHFQRGAVAASIRLLPSRIPTLESLHLPPVLTKLTERRQGLVLVTGPTGCGKTSTLAALIDLINSRSRFHIVAIEDPIDYHHPNLQSIVEQIEVGRDTPDDGDGSYRRRNRPYGIFHSSHQRCGSGGFAYTRFLSGRQPTPDPPTAFSLPNRRGRTTVGAGGRWL